MLATDCVHKKETIATPGMAKNLIWRLVSLSATYPVALPALLAYAVSKDQKYLDLLYSVRSLTHGVPLKGGLRLYKFNDVSLVYPSREDPNFEDVYLRNVYFPYKPTKRDIVFDIGAHMGFFSLKVAKKVNKIIAFEPDIKNYKFLCENIDRNKLRNVLPINTAIGKEDGSLFLERCYGQGRTKVTNLDTGCPVDVRSIDSIAATLGILPAVIKIDTEGFEIPVLQGAESVIAKAKPKLLIASYHYPNEAYEVANYLAARKYQCYRYKVAYTLQTARETYIYAESIGLGKKNE